MQWSKTKKQLKALICPELQDRVDFYVTRFREAHDQKGRAWITLDGEQVFDCGYYKWHLAVWKEKKRLIEESATKPVGKEYLHFHQTACETVESNLILEERNFKDALTAYIDTPIKSALVSSNLLIRAFSFIDRRLGKRTFERISLADNEHPLVQTFYELRAGVFGMNTVLKS
jgi:hypothetical protein